MTEHIPTPEPGLPRRSLLRGALLGLAAGPPLALTGGAIKSALELTTNVPAGNPGYDNREIPSPGVDTIQTNLIFPITEELTYRALPSALTDRVIGHDAVTSVEATLKGPENAGVDRRTGRTRRSLIIGAIGGVLSTAAFGAVHNYTGKGFDTSNVPVGALFSGSAFWALQRKFGLLANTSAHMSHNIVVTILRAVTGRR